MSTSMGNLKGALLATTVMAGMAIATPAFAQDTTQPAPPAGPPAGGTTQGGSTAATGPGVVAQEAVPPAQGQGGEIIITGTLIRNPNLTSSAPVAVVGQEEIRLRQSNTAEEILRTIPGVVAGVGNNVNNGQTGSATIDLRGMGSQRNLQMLDSTRLVPSSSGGSVDLNNIPLALVDRVDVLTGGASTTYGADAVTGVVNFITKKNFAGMDLSASEQITERGDANVFRTDLVLGGNFADNRGNAVLAIGYIESDPVYFGARDSGQCVINSISGFCGGDSPTATPTSFGFSGAQLVAGGFPAGAGNLQVGQPGGTGLLTPQYAVFNFNPYNIYQTPFKRYNAYGAAHYDVTDRLTVYGRGLFSKNIIASIVAPSGVFGEALTVPGNNPFLTTAVRNQLCALNSIALGPTCDTNPAIPLGIVYRRTLEVGPRIDTYTTNVFDTKAGFTYNMFGNISLDIYGTYGESERRQVRQNYVAKSRLQQALNATNATTCTVNSNGCVPLNLFGQPGTITPAMAGFIGGVTSSILQTASLAQVHGVISGDFGYDLPWSSKPISFAVGAEHRDYTATRQPDNLASVPGELGGAGGAILPIKGGYTATDYFAEVIAPIASGHPFFQDLTLEGGIRYSGYIIDTGTGTTKPRFNATTWKVGATWQPVDALKFRGNYQHAVRAPNIGELFAPVTTGLTNLGHDPCAGTTVPANVTATLPLNTNLSNANLRAVCLAQGAQAAQIGAILEPAAGQANVTSGGNPNLKPEKANTWTVGAVITPRSFLPNFSATIDYYNIKITNAITTPTPGDLIAACFGDPNGTNVSASAATSLACTQIRRSPTNGRLSGSPATVPGLFAPLTNAGILKTDGVDVTMNYRHRLGSLADLILNFNGNYTHNSQLQASPSSAIGPNCAAVYSVNCGISIGQLQPKYSWNERTTFRFPVADVSLLWRHISSFHYQSDLPPLFSGVITGGGPLAGQTFNFNKIKAFDYFDLGTRFNIGEHFELTLTAFNLFDKKPPIVGNNAASTTAGSGNTFPSIYDSLGRRYGAQLRVRF